MERSSSEQSRKEEDRGWEDGKETVFEQESKVKVGTLAFHGRTELVI